ncbi:MAG: DUF2490 domain-containing protein [Schleiferiaceae bacterium]
MKCKNLFIIGFVLAAFGVTAQTVTDNRVWTKLTYRLEPAKGLDVDISGLYRSVGGDEGMDRWITELQVTKKQSKSLNYSTEFRHYAIFDDVGATQGTNQRIRFRVNATKGYDLGRDEFSMRYGIQHRTVLSGGGSDRTDLRVRGAYTKNFKDWKWDPTIYSEYLGSVNGNLSRRLRIGAESSNKMLGGKVSFGYFYQHNFSLSSPHYHTMTVGYRL